MINIKKGNPAQRGAQKTGSMSYNFAFAGVSDNITLLIFDGRKNLKCRVELDETYKTGDVFSCNISGENLDKAMYCYESDGKMIPDLYAKTVTCCSEFNKIQDNARYLSRIVLDEFDWEGDMPLQTPYEDSIFYKIHVRGYFLIHEWISSFDHSLHTQKPPSQTGRRPFAIPPICCIRPSGDMCSR